MSRISISKASKDFKVSRNTIYKALEKGKLTRDADGKVDVIDLMRLFGEHTSTAQQSTAVTLFGALSLTQPQTLV